MTNTLETILEHHRQGQGNIISLLQDTQESFGYIPKEAIDFFSSALGISTSRFYGVATFYSQFRLKPVGKHRVTACCGTACHVRGAEKILNSLNRELSLSEDKDTTDDGEITIEKVACLGTCSFAPVVLIDGETHGKAGADDIVKKVRSLKKDE